MKPRPLIAGRVVERTNEDEFRDTLEAAHTRGELPVALLNRSLKWMRVRKPQPMRVMRTNDLMCSEESTHSAWCEQILDQYTLAPLPDRDLNEKCSRKSKSLLGRAWRQRGNGSLDKLTTQRDTDNVVRNWDASPAIPADLLPRALYQCGNAHWHESTW